MAHNSYYGCDKCQVRGILINECFFFVNAPLRTNHGFINFSYNSYQKDKSPLTELNFPMVSGFPVDYMHAVCLGIMRKLLFLWRYGSRLFRITPAK